MNHVSEKNRPYRKNLAQLHRATLPLLAAAACQIFIVSGTHGATTFIYDWTGNSSAAWTSSANWVSNPSGGTTPGTATVAPFDYALFNNAGNGNTAITGTGNISLSLLTFDNTAGTLAPYTIGATATSDTITLNTPNTFAPSIVIDPNVTTNVTINDNLVFSGLFAANLTYSLIANYSPFSTLTVNGAITASNVGGIIGVGGNSIFNGVISGNGSTGSSSELFVGLNNNGSQQQGLTSPAAEFNYANSGSAINTTTIACEQYPGTVTLTAANTYDNAGASSLTSTSVEALNTLVLSGNGSIANGKNQKIDIESNGTGEFGGTLQMDYSSITANAGVNRLDNSSSIIVGPQSNLILIGNSNAAVNQTIASFLRPASGSSGGNFYLTIPTANTTLTLQGVSGTTNPLSAPNSNLTMLFRGPSFAASVGNGPVILNNASGGTGLPTASGGTFASPGTPNQGVINGIIGDASATGYGSGFVTMDPATGNNRVRLLQADEYVNSFASVSGITNNVSLSGNSAATTVSATVTANTLVMNSGTTVTINSGQVLNNSFGVLSTGIIPSTIAGPGALNLSGIALVYTSNDLALSAVASDAYAPLTKSGPATLNLGGTGIVTNQGLDITQGTVRLQANNGFIASNSGNQFVIVEQGGYFDLNGYNQSVTNTSNTRAAEGLITNTSATTSTFTITTAASILSPVAGNINLVTDPGSGNTVTLGAYAVNSGSLLINSGILTMSGSFLGCGGPVVLGNGSTGTELNVNKNSIEIPNGLTDPAGLGTGSGTGMVTSILTSAATYTAEIDVTSGSTTTFGGSVDNNGTGLLAIYKSGQGTQIFTGASASNFTGTITAGGGNLTFNATANTTNSLYGTTTPITFNGGTVNYLGNSAGTAQTSSGPMTIQGTGAQLNVAAGGSGNTTIIFGSLSPSGDSSTQPLTSNASINFNPVNNNSGGVATIAFTTSPTLANGILGLTTSVGAGYATLGNIASGYSWATYSGSGPTGSVVAYNETSGTNHGGSFVGASDAATTNYTATNNITVIANDAASTLQINGGSSMTFSSNTTTLNSTNSLGIMYTGNGAYTIGNAVHNGVIGYNANSVSAQLYIQNFGGNLTINSDLAALFVSYGGTGTVILTGAETCSTSGIALAIGGGGIVDVQNPLALSNATHASTTAVNSGSTLQLDGGITTLNNAVIYLGGMGSGNIGGISSVNGNNTILGNIYGTQDASILNNTASTTLTLAGLIADLATGLSTSQHCNLTLGGVGNISITGTLSTGLSINGTQSLGVRGLTKVGTGTLTLSNANLFAGGLTIDNGMVNINSDAALSTPLSGASGSASNGLIQAPLNFNSGTGNTATLQYAASFNLNSSRLITVQSGNARFDTQSFNTTIGSNVNGPGSLEKAGSGTLILAGDNAYTGGTVVTAGTLVAGSPFGSSTGSGIVTLNGGVLASLATTAGGYISGNVNAGSGAHIIAPGGIGSIGTLTLNGLSTSSLTTINFDLGAGTGPLISSGDLLNLGTGTVTIGSGTMLTLGNTPISGDDYRLIGDTSNGSVVSAITLSNFVTPTTPGLSYLLSNTVDPGYIDLVVTTAGASTITWNNSGGSPSDGVTWNASGSLLNWDNAGNAVAYSNTSNGALGGDNVTFNDRNNGHYNVSIVSLVTPTSTTVNNSSLGYTFNGSGGIGGLGGLTKTGSASLTLAETNTYSGTTNVSAGTLILAAAGALPSGTNLNIASGAMVFANDIGNAVGLEVGSLAISGKLDLNNNALIVHNNSIGTITTLVASGYNRGAWNGSTGIAGIVSTAAMNSSTHLTALGVIQNSGDGTTTGTVLYSTFENQTGLVATDVLVKYTYYGDTNLDGKVDGTDYSRIDSAFLAEQSGGAMSGWYNGDFNYDNVVDGSDYTLMDNAFNSQGTQLLAEIAFPTAQIAAVATSSVPEPATLSLLGIGVVSLLGRRRRR